MTKDDETFHHSIFPSCGLYPKFPIHDHKIPDTSHIRTFHTQLAYGMVRYNYDTIEYPTARIIFVILASWLARAWYSLAFGFCRLGFSTLIDRQRYDLRNLDMEDLYGPGFKRQIPSLDRHVSRSEFSFLVL
ncbi:hypothetical protein VTL71DRAFT_3375 [Oculimacula yallundae]|uniref:Uncharacterized protein n=1 Tax=Oculimacula yallundae TaxID=86028 RepID=A0ABR4C720_9HELO